MFCFHELHFLSVSLFNWGCTKIQLFWSLHQWDTKMETRPTHRTTDANLYPLERQLNKASEPLFTLKEGPNVKSNIRRFLAQDFV